MERRNSELERLFEKCSAEKLVEEGVPTLQKASEVVKSGLFNPGKIELSLDDLQTGVKHALEETISTCLSLKKTTESQNTNLLEVTRFLTESIKNLQMEN